MIGVNNYQKYFGSPEAVDRTFRNACRDCSKSYRSRCKRVPCEDCNIFFIEGFAAGIKRIEWLQEEDNN